MLQRKLGLVLLCFGIYSCSIKNAPSENEIKTQISNLSSLGTVEFSFTKLIMTSDDQSYSIGDRKILLSCQAHAKAGVNFEKIVIEHMDWNKKEIEIAIPKGEIIFVSIPAEEFKNEFQKIGTFRDNFENKEIQQIQVLAEQEIMSKVAEFDITNKAQDNAKTFLEHWLSTFGFEKVKIRNT